MKLKMYEKEIVKAKYFRKSNAVAISLIGLRDK